MAPDLGRRPKWLFRSRRWARYRPGSHLLFREQASQRCPALSAHDLAGREARPLHLALAAARQARRAVGRQLGHRLPPQIGSFLDQMTRAFTVAALIVAA